VRIDLNISAVWAITSYTFKEAIRAKWLLIFAIVFFLLAVNIPMLVLLAARYLPPNYLDVYLTTLVSLSFPFIPLLPLPMGSGTIVEERESGTLQYMMANPISKTDFLLGRMLGMVFATTSVILLGFGIASIMVYNVDFTRYTPVLTTTLIAATLNAIMLGVALVISILSKRKSTAMGVAIFVWFLLTVLSDLGFLSVIVNLKAGVAATLPIILLNPIEVARILAVSSFGGDLSALGTTGLIVNYYLGSAAGEVMTIILLVWLAVFVALDFILFRHQDVV
jgi:Cu-processing system permease protein